MPIEPDELESVLLLDQTTSVRQVVSRLLGGEPYSQWSTVVAPRDAGGFYAFTLVELNDAADRMGSAVLDTTLGELLADRVPAQTVEWAETKSLRRAQDEARRAPGQRLLVLKDGQPLGVVRSGTRGSAATATVIQLYKAEAAPDVEKLVQWGMRTDFLPLRPQITLKELAWTLRCAEGGFAIVPLAKDAYALLERGELDRQAGEFSLDRLGHHTIQEVYAARQRTGKRYPIRPADTVDASQVRSAPSRDEVVLHQGKPIGYRLSASRKGGLTPRDGGGERYVNAWFEGHDSRKPLARGTPYDLGINVGAQRADSYVYGETYRGPLDEEVFVGLVGDPDAWRIDGPAVQRLYIPAEGNSEPVFFQVTPLKQGQQQLVAHFYHRNHLIQTVEITGIQVVVSGEPGVAVLRGQRPLAVTLTRAAAGTATADRDANLYIEWLPDQDRFRFTFFSAQGEAEPLWHSARIPLTAEQMWSMAETARDTIETHLVYYKEGGTFPFHLLSEDENQQLDAAYQKALMALARLGYRWFIGLFYQVREPALKEEAEKMGDLLLQASASGSLHLQIVSSDFYLPWNLLYTAPSGQREPLTPQAVSAEGIWGFRHVIEQVPARDLSHLRSSAIIDASAGLKISAHINLNIDRTVYKPATEQLEFFKAKASDAALKLELTTRFNEDEALQAFQGEADAEEVMYFFCHALTKGDPKTRFEESRLILTEESRALTLGDLVIGTFGLPPLSQAPLVFLNACGSAEMDARFYDSFVQFMRDRGARTVIGTLNDTPIYAGAEFAKKFFDQFLQGGPQNAAAKLLFRLRREFLEVYRNPIGLSYALFYNGDTYVKRDA